MTVLEGNDGVIPVSLHVLRPWEAGYLERIDRLKGVIVLEVEPCKIEQASFALASGDGMSGNSSKWHLACQETGSTHV